MQHFERVVRRQVETIETGVGARKTRGLAPLLYAKLSRPVTSSKRLKALIGYAGSSSHKLEKAQTLIVVELLLDYKPEPLNDDVRVVISTPADFFMWECFGGL